MATNEVEKIRNRYRRREEAGLERMYDALNPCNVYWHAESQIAIASLLPPGGHMEYPSGIAACLKSAVVPEAICWT